MYKIKIEGKNERKMRKCCKEIIISKNVKKKYSESNHKKQ